MPLDGDARRIATSACPHDCPSGCSLDVTLLGNNRIGRVSGSKAQTYTAGVICAKVARYAERVHHADRVLYPMRRTGPKGWGSFERIGWDEALDEIAARFKAASDAHGPETIWPYHSGGTMGQVQRYAMECLRHVMGWSRQHSSICMTPAESGWRAGVGALKGVDPREMRESDLIVMWGGNPVSTQVNVMTHVTHARRTRGTKLAVVDVYRTPTVDQADIALIVNPGTDGALALAMMNVMLREGLADREYLARFTDFSPDIEAHIATRTPAWAAPITGLGEQQIIDFARLVGSTKKTFFRLGFGFTRTRNGSAAMHAVTALPAVTGAWREHGGGAYFISWDRSGWGFDTAVLHGLDKLDPKVRILDQSRIGAVLTGEAAALKGGPPVTAMLMQNANSAEVAPDSQLVAKGLAREDLFLVVHEQFLTPTARYADILLPATTFLEHDDIYAAYGHTHLTFGPKLIEPAGETRSNHWVRCEIGKRAGARHPGLEMTERELIDDGFRRGGLGGIEAIERDGWIDRPPSFEDAHFLNGFGHKDGKFKFQPDWAAIGPYSEKMPKLIDWMPDYECADAEHPLKLVTPPARNFLNTSFTETSTSRAKEGALGPTLMIHPETAEKYGVSDGRKIRIGNARGEVVLHARLEAGQRPGTVVAEGIWPAAAHEDGRGINTLIGEDPVPPNGGVGFHDTAVWLKPE